MLKGLEVLMKLLVSADMVLALGERISARKPQLEQLKANGERVPPEFWEELETDWMDGDTPLDSVADRARANQ